MRLCLSRSLIATGIAPTGPRVQHHGFTLQISQADRLAFKGRKGEIGGNAIGALFCGIGISRNANMPTKSSKIATKTIYQTRMARVSTGAWAAVARIESSVKEFCDALFCGPRASCKEVSSAILY